MKNDWAQERAEPSLDPAAVARVLREIEARWEGDSFADFLRDFPLGENALLHLFAVSEICTERIKRDPTLLRWLARPDICDSERGPRRMAAELRAFSDDSSAQNFRGLRLWKGREMTRIALREIAEAAALQQTTLELSYLAEICLSTVLGTLTAQMRERYGAPETEFTVLGLGKLGGRELNHSSDIDLIIFYGSEGSVSARVSNHLWFNRLAESLLKIFNAHDPAGLLFRVDLRLRPEGTAGPLTRSLESAENYYAGFGEVWERLALIKARGVAGSEELAYEFLRQHQPFIFPRSPTPEFFDEMASIKQRIEREVPSDQLNVKLGVGGIREIEFVVQALQFIHGARHAFLQDSSTLKALLAIAELDLLSRSEVATLERSYRFLRKIEHRVQMENERQTHSLPVENAKRELLAGSLGLAGEAALLEELNRTMSGVREIFRRVVSSDLSPPQIAADFFADQPRAEKALAELEQGSSHFHVAPRTRQIFHKLRPLLLAQLARTADPDATLTAILRFVESFGLRSLLFELLTTNPRLLQLLVETFEASEYAAQLLVRSPNWLEEITRSQDLDQPRSLLQHRKSLASAIEKKDFDSIRTYKQRQSLGIIIRDILGLNNLRSLLREQSDLAEAILLAVNTLTGATDLTIVAMGKFGGRELGYGSDLDLMFVGSDHRAAQNLANCLSASNPLGQLASIDVRLRPEGDNGPLVASIEAFANYYRDRAQLWELQALTRARVITGPDKAAFYEIAHAGWSVTGRDPQLFEKIDAMLERVRRERGTGDDFLNFKTGVGGIVEAEFMVQALQMHHDRREVSMLAAIKKLDGVLSRSESTRLLRAYEFLRRGELVLRRRSNKSENALPANEAELRRFTRRLGFADFEEWRTRYEAARADIHEIYQRYFTRGRN